jgi:hypothetical protein
MYHTKTSWMALSLALLSTAILHAQISPTNYYGSGIKMDALANIRVSGPVSGYSMISYRFRATQNAVLTSVKPYLINYASAGTGYAKGDGGDMRLELREDDDTYEHLPSSTVLATVTYEDAMHADSSDFAHTFTFPSSPSVTAGKIYHLVWTNTDPDPANNYISLNFAWYTPGQNPAQPTMRPEDFAALAFDGTQWTELVPPETTGSYIPIVSIAYGNGLTQGLGYYQISVRRTIGGTLAVRVVIDVTGSDRTVSRVSVRAKRLSGTADLRIELQDSAGATLRNCYVPDSLFPQDVDTYVTCPYTAALTLQAGSRYYLVLQASSGTTYDALALTNGAESTPNYGDETTFPDGHAEYKSGSSWTAWDGNNDNLFYDLQFYFTLQ